MTSKEDGQALQSIAADIHALRERLAPEAAPAPETPPTYEEELGLKCREVILIYDEEKADWVGYTSTGPVRIMLLSVPHVSEVSGWVEPADAALVQFINLCSEDGSASLNFDDLMTIVTRSA